MGAVPTELIDLSFFSTRRAPTTTPGEQVNQISCEKTIFNPNKTYIAFIVGNGDNIAFLMGHRI
jgi:hypothetical protein